MNATIPAPYRVAEYGPIDDWSDFHFVHPRFSRPIAGKQFLRDDLGLTGAEISLNRLAPGVAVPFLHRHRENEEIYLFLGGTGEFQAGEAVFPVKAGTVVSLPPATARSWRNTGDAALAYIVIQVVAGSYRGIGKVDDGEGLTEPPAWAR